MHLFLKNCKDTYLLHHLSVVSCSYETCKLVSGAKQSLNLPSICCTYVYYSCVIDVMNDCWLLYLLKLFGEAV